MDHKEQHHQHHQKEREQEKKKQHAHEQGRGKKLLPFHPAWLVVGVALMLLALLVWMVLPR